MKKEDAYAYSDAPLERLMKQLAQYGVLPWLNPVNNAICIKNFSFLQHQSLMLRPFRQD